MPTYLLTIVTLFSKFIMIRIFSVITNKRVKANNIFSFGSYKNMCYCYGRWTVIEADNLWRENCWEKRLWHCKSFIVNCKLRAITIIYLSMMHIYFNITVFVPLCSYNFNALGTYKTYGSNTKVLFFSKKKIGSCFYTCVYCFGMCVCSISQSIKPFLF